MSVSNHRRHAHAQPRHHEGHHAGGPGGLSAVRQVLLRKPASRHRHSAKGADVGTLGAGVVAVSLSIGLVGSPAAMAVSGSLVGTSAPSVPTDQLAGPVTAPADAVWTLPDTDVPQVVMPPAPPLTTAAIKQYAASLVGAGQFGCLDRLWSRESHWDPAARNASSDAFGIPQSLPGSKMATAGADWQTNPLTQVRWGISYIRSAYGTPCGAWAHSQATGWY